RRTAFLPEVRLDRDGSALRLPDRGRLEPAAAGPREIRGLPRSAGTVASPDPLVGGDPSCACRPWRTSERIERRPIDGDLGPPAERRVDGDDVEAAPRVGLAFPREIFRRHLRHLPLLAD